jgi:hypothetical protein
VMAITGNTLALGRHLCGTAGMLRLRGRTLDPFRHINDSST